MKGFFGAGTTVILGPFCPKSGKANKLEVMNNLIVTLGELDRFPYIFSDESIVVCACRQGLAA